MSKIKFYNCDCIDFMKCCPSKKYDLAIVDPPYGININMNIGRRKNDIKKHKKKSWDIAPDKNYFDELFRICSNLIIWGANNFNFIPPSNGWIVWDKQLSGYVDFSECEIAYTNIKNTIKKFVYKAQTNENYSVKIHPTQKPIELYRWLLKNYAKPGDSIFDSHGGSMSIACACHDMGFDLDVCELDKDYFKAGKKRFENYSAQGRLI